MTHAWAILQLREVSDPLPVEEIQRDLLAYCPHAQLHFPATKAGLLDRENPLSAYLFVRTPASLKLERSQFVTRFLRDPVTHRIQKITDAELSAMAPAVLLPPLGATVRITNGDFEGLEATVVDSTPEQQIVALVELWSRQALVTLQPNEFTDAQIPAQPVRHQH